MKKLLLLVLLCCVLAGCGTRTDQVLHPTSQEDQWTMPPHLIYEGKTYISPEMSVSQLPEGFAYAGTVSEEMANDLDVVGQEYYIHPDVDDELYTRHQSGTHRSGSVQEPLWAYSHWVAEAE